MAERHKISGTDSNNDAHLGYWDVLKSLGYPVSMCTEQELWRMYELGSEEARRELSLRFEEAWFHRY